MDKADGYRGRRPRLGEQLGRSAEAVNAGPGRIVDAKVAGPPVPLCESRRGDTRRGGQYPRVALPHDGNGSRNGERATQVSGVVGGVFDVNLRCRGVMRLEMPVHDLRTPVVVVGRHVHVFGRQERQPDDAERRQASREAPQNRSRHVAEYTCLETVALTEEKFRETSVKRASANG